MEKKEITLVDDKGKPFKAFKMWDNYITVSAKTAKELSVTGKLPPIGYEVKANFTFSGPFEKRQAWLSRTVYDGKTCFYIN